MLCPQIVCGILAVVMGSVACIEEKGSFGNLGLGIPTGLSTVLAAGMYDYDSRCYKHFYDLYIMLFSSNNVFISTIVEYCD